MRRRLRIVTAVLGVLAAVGVPANALADPGNAPTLQCATTPTTPFFSGTFRSVTVPPNQTCNLSDATVERNVTVGVGGSVNFEDSGTVGGHLFVGSQAAASEGSGWVIAGPALAVGAGDLTILGAVRGVVATDTEILGLQGATVDGNIVSTGGQFGGEVFSSVIRGNLIINNTGVSGSADWFIGGPQSNGNPQEIDGNVILTGNEGPIFVFGNHVGRNLICENNDPAPSTSFEGLTNIIDRHSLGQCAPAG